MKTERVYLRYDLDINDTRRYVNRVYLHSVVQAEGGTDAGSIAVSAMT